MKNLSVLLIIASLFSNASFHAAKTTSHIDNNYEACMKAEIPEKSIFKAEHVPGELVVTMDVGTSRQIIRGIKKSEEFIEEFGCHEYECLSQELIDSRCSLSVNRDIHVSYLIRYDDITDEHLYNALCRIKKNSSVDAVEPNYVRLNNSVENPVDKYYSKQWGLRAINAPQVWSKYGAGSYGTRIGILDDGVYPHEDLYLDSSLSRDFSAGGDRYGTGHGTHVAGICGAIGDNTHIVDAVESGVGVVGVCQNVTVVDLKVASKVWIKDDDIPEGGYYTSLSYDSTVIKAVNYAISKWETSQRISVLNYSYSGYSYKYATILGGFTVRNPVTRNIFLSFRSFPGTVVWSAGNDAKPCGDNSYRYCPNLISIGSIDKSGKISDFSNWGPAVNIYAPGSEIFSTIKEKAKYEAWDGTSMAAPFVSGVAAYLYTKFPGITARQVKDAIVESVDYEKVIHTGNGVLEPIKKLDFLAAYNKAFELFNSTDSYPLKLEMLNCEGDKWKILIQNTGKSTLKIAYPESNCSEQNVAEFSSNNCKTLSLGGKKSKIIEINYDKNKGMCFPAGVYSNGIRKISYLYCVSGDWNVGTDLLLFEVKNTTSSVLGKHLSKAPQPGLDFEIKSSRINWFVRDWKIAIKNKVNMAVDVMYNSKMCFYGDGLDWKNLADVEQMSLAPYESSSQIWINANGTADAIAMCIVYVDDYGLKRGYVTVANGISDNGHGTLGHKTVSL